MKQKQKLGRFLILFLATIGFCPIAGMAAVQVSENFDNTNWPFVSSSSSFTNFTNSITGWAIDNGTIYKNTSGGASNFWTSPSNSCIISSIRTSPSAIRSPMCSNGVGSVTFFQRGAASATIIAVETSDTGASWATIAFITNTYATATWPWPSFTTPINSPSNLLIRLRASGGGGLGYLDDVSITYPPPNIALSGLTNSPARPIDQDPVTISANVTIIGVADTLALTNFWREWPATNWTLTAMTANGPNLYTNVIPGKSIGALAEYYARATYTADGVTYNTNSSTNAYTVIPRSSYTNLSVTGQVAAPLRNGANFQWQGVIQVTNVNPTFKFQGISNAVTTTWGDVNQSVTNTPLYGQAEVTTSNITLYTTNTGYYLFSLNETNLDYTVRSCTYENFSTWTAATYNGSSTYTNNNWILTSGNTSNDVSRIFSGTGRSAIVETNGWVRSPYLSNGVGQISFWYRNWPTNGTPTGKTIVQTSSNAITWTDLSGGTVSNIISTNYLFSSVSANDRASKYVRILNTNSTARLCLDEIAITDPGAGVSAANYSPTNATYLDSITLSADLTPYNGAIISGVTVSYRVGPTGAWETASMTNNGIHYALSAPIIGVPVGSLYYLLNCTFTGFQANSPIVFPVGSTNEVTIGNVIDNHYEPLDASSWPYTNSSSASRSFTNATTGWAIENATLYRNTSAASSNFWTSPSNSCILNPSFGPVSALKSPLFTNTVGGLTFTSRGSSGFIVAVETSSNGTDWITYRYVTNNTALPWITNSVAFGTISNCQIRIRAAGSAVSGYIDDIRVSYPPANVIITNVYINPGYPVAGQPFTVDCDIISINPNSPAYNITPTFAYWPNGGTASNVVMDRPWIQGTTNHYHAAGTLAAVTRDTLYLYEVRASFDGYYGSILENQSPKTNSPTGSFTTRAFVSSYGGIDAILNGTNTSARMLTNGLWQSIVSFTSGTGSTFNLSFQGSGYSAGAGYLTNSVAWGNSNNWKTTLPLSDFAGSDQTNITLTGSFTGDYVVRFNEQTGEYFVQKCLFQDFNAVGYDTLDKYALKGLSKTSAGSGIKNFNSWPTNVSQSRVDDFSTGNWSTATNVPGPEAFGGGSYGYLSWYNSYSNTTMRSYTVSKPSDSYFVQPSHWDPQPILDGIGMVICSFKPLLTSNAPAQMTIYATPTNGMDQAADFTTSANWKFLANTNNITNTTSTCVWTNLINTNLTLDIIFAPTSKMSIVKLEVRDWYAAENGTNGWVAHQSWIETDPAAPGTSRCRFETSRAKPGMDQGLESPAITGGVSLISFSYSGLSTSPVGFVLQACYTNPGDWATATNLATVSNVVFASPSVYSTFTFALMSTKPLIYLRVKNITPKPGALLLQNFQADGFATIDDWYVNNANIDYMASAPPLLARQFSMGAGYLNSNYVADVATGATNAPDTNIATCIKSPASAEGIGEISFWYRNWSTNSPAQPARIKVQKSVTGGNTEPEWTDVASISNITNINDYAYYKTDIYDPNSHYVRIRNDLTYSNAVGRVCLDDILITAPWASTLSMSNLVITPSIPLYTNRVDVAVDAYNLFYQPSNLVMTAYYATGTTYTAMTSAPAAYLSMSCISTSGTASNPRYRYQTQGDVNIPPFSSDTFVRYGVKAIFSGYHTEITSPMTNKQFSTVPAWYDPLPTQYGTSNAFYVVFSCPTGSVWINEFNIKDFPNDYSGQYLELCGIATSDIRNWMIQVRNSIANTQAVYVITNNSTFSNATNGYGFWVIGTSGITTRDQTLTNQFSDRGGFRILRPSGVYGDSISYGVDASAPIPALTNQGFTYVGYDDKWINTSYGLEGTNSTSFSWTWGSDGTYTPGTINEMQFFAIAGSTGTPPIVLIYAFSIINTNVMIECSRTNDWYPSPWYSTNLLSSNLWAIVSGATLTNNATNYVLRFTTTPNLTPIFYKVVSTNGP